MVCPDCAEAADIVTAKRAEAIDLNCLNVSPRLEKIVKDLHSMCTPTICDCQHKIDWEGTKHVRI